MGTNKHFYNRRPDKGIIFTAFSIDLLLSKRANSRNTWAETCALSRAQTTGGVFGQYLEVAYTWNVVSRLVAQLSVTDGFSHGLSVKSTQVKGFSCTWQAHTCSCYLHELCIKPGSDDWSTWPIFGNGNTCHVVGASLLMYIGVLGQYLGNVYMSSQIVCGLLVQFIYHWRVLMSVRTPFPNLVQVHLSSESGFRRVSLSP